MSKSRKKVESTHAGTGRTCGECRLGKWNEENFDYLGKPFLIYCEHARYAYSKRAMCPVTMSHLEACPKFSKGTRI